jgi:ankyrin repeat protein
MDVSDFRAGRTPLQLAISTNKLISVKALLSAGANPKGSLFHAIKINYADCEPMMRLLCNAGTDPNEVDNQQRTPLMVAASARPTGAYGQKLENTIKPLVKFGALIDMRDMLGQTALHLAVIRDNVDTVKELLDCNINTQLVDHFGNKAIDITEDDDIKTLLARADLKKRFKGAKQRRR